LLIKIIWLRFAKKQIAQILPSFDSAIKSTPISGLCKSNESKTLWGTLEWCHKLVNLLEKIEEELEKGLSVRSISLSDEENLIIKQLGFLTAKPIIYATNLNENDLAEGNDFSSKVQSFASNENTECIKISAQVESELIELEPEDKKDYLIGLGVEEGGLSSLIRSTYKLLGLKTYFTTGEKETKAWTIKDGMTAPQAAGVIHTDFEKGFIRAQTISYQNLIDSGSIANAKTKGLLRSEGKEYIVNEGDVMEFLFNV